MRFKLLTLFISTLLSVTIFSILTSNSFAFFTENQEKLFIEDTVIIKVLDGELYTSVYDIVDLFDENQLNYVMYYKEDETIYVLNSGYDKMMNMKMNGGIIEDQTINGYNYKQFDLNSNVFEVFLAVEDMGEDELVNLFLNENTGFTDGSIGMYSQGYDGILSIQLYAIFFALIGVVNYMYFSLFIHAQKEKIGIQKLLGYTTSSITKKYVSELFLYYFISFVFVYMFNFEYINFMFSQSYVFYDIIYILFVYVITIMANVFLCGAIINYYTKKLTVTAFLREVAYE